MMKSTSKGRKLSIKRESIRVLNQSEAEQVKGGGRTAGAPCTGVPPVLRPLINSDGAPCGSGRNI